MKISIVDRFNGERVYPLGEALKRAGDEVVLLDFYNFSFDLHGRVYYDAEVLDTNIDYVLWRLSENMFPAAKTLISALADDGFYLVNGYDTLNVCANKLSTYRVMVENNLPVVDTYTVLPGRFVPKDFVAKPAYGAGGRGVLFGGANVSVPRSSLEPWVMQPFVPDDDNAWRVLCLNEEILSSYHRVGNLEATVNNVEAGGRRVFANPPVEIAELALSSVAAVGASGLVGVDITADGRIMELNGAPGFPDQILTDVAKHLTNLFSY